LGLQPPPAEYDRFGARAHYSRYVPAKPALPARATLLGRRLYFPECGQNVCTKFSFARAA
jgi:hypothetical protein